MKWFPFLGILLVCVLVVGGEWPSLQQKKEKAAVFFIALAAMVLAVLLLINPQLPGPSELVHYVLGGLDKTMK